MKINRFLIMSLLVAFPSIVFGQTILNPTGTYDYKGKSVKIDGHTFGPYTGTIQVKRIADKKIVITFFVCKGEPSYNSGGFTIDTLKLLNNIAIYTDPEADSSCKITFKFDKKGVTVKEETADFNAGCGFGHAVVANGRYKKVSSKIPILTDALTGEELK